MEKNRIRPIKTGKSFRMSYSRQKEVLEMPNLIEVQKDSYQWFLDEGLKEVFDDISPIADYSGHLSLEFVDFTLCEDDVKYTIDECKERDATYAAPLKVRVRLSCCHRYTTSFTNSLLLKIILSNTLNLYFMNIILYSTKSIVHKHSFQISIHFYLLHQSTFLYLL